MENTRGIQMESDHPKTTILSIIRVTYSSGLQYVHVSPIFLVFYEELKIRIFLRIMFKMIYVLYNNFLMWFIC